MATFDYQEMRDTATDMFEEFGNPFILKKPDGEPRYNPKTKKTEQLYKDYTGICVMKTYEAEVIGTLNNVINAGDVTFKCVMDDINIIPEASKDKLIYEGVTYNLITPASADPSGSFVIVHTLLCRKA